MKELFAKVNLRRLLLYVLYLFLVLVFQTMALTQLRPLGVCPFILPAAAVAVGMFEGASWGAVFGLVLGIFTDMAYVESTIGYTLLFPAIAFAVGFVSQFFINRRFFAFMVATCAALLITGVFQMVKVLVSEGWSFSLLYTVILQTVWSLVPAVLAYLPPAKWLD